MNAREWLLTLNLAATAAMTGLIWFVQVVHYPLMERVGREVFAAYEREHVQLTGPVVGPPMLVELACALGLVLPGVLEGRALVAAWVALALLGVVWVATATASVPMHARLVNGFDPAAHAWLVNGNWIRTVAWTARLAIAVLWLRPGSTTH
jgi:hypothetical protein